MTVENKHVTLFGRFRGARRGELSGVSLACKLASKPSDQAAGPLTRETKRRHTKAFTGVMNHCFGVQVNKPGVWCIDNTRGDASHTELRAASL